MSSETPDQTAARIRAVADRFFAAVEAGDIEGVKQCYHPDVVIWHNIDGLEKSRETNLQTLAGFVKRAPERRYLERRVDLVAGGFVQQHVVRAVRHDGFVLTMPACVICKVEGEQITRLDEYFDTAALTGWFDVG
ncbi:nuclear transport factor 2 family protein [Sphingobium lactosutens]|uniref:nuclear transport factor 2 family protein n=1 Tax=Sphingobium lactosutens TaxID=522773 RepID=UPI0015BB4B93|nr:nuclear transport factor 2 family protein [Sphingobium lactosutens]